MRRNIIKKPKRMLGVALYSRRAWRLGAILVTVALILVTSYLKLSNNDDVKENVVYIHYVGRASPKFEGSQLSKNYSLSKLHEKTLEEYLKRTSLKYPGLQFKLITYDNHSDSTTTKAIYRDIIIPSLRKNKGFVIDNSWGEEFSVCRDLIRKDSVPVISLNADHYKHDYNNNVVFIGYGDDIPNTIASFTKKILDSTSVMFVTEKGYHLTNSYYEEFAKKGVAVRDTINIFSSKPEDPLQADSIFRVFKLAAEKTPSLPIVLNFHHQWGDFFLKKIKDDNSINSLEFIVPIYAMSNLSNELTDLRNNEFIVMSSGQDAISKRITDDVEMFRKKNDSGWFNRFNVHEFLYRCTVAMDIFEDYFAKDTTYNNHDFLKYLKRLQDHPIHNAENQYFFEGNDSLTEFKSDRFFSIYKNDKLSSFGQQLGRDDSIVTNLFFGMEIDDILKIDTKAGTYDLSFYYWYKVDSSHKDIVIDFPDLKQESSTLLLTRNVEGEIVYKLFKATGTCSQDFDLKEFPYDKQVLKLTAEIVDPSTKISVSFDEEMLQKDKYSKSRIHLKGWQLHDHSVTVDTRITTYSKGIVATGIHKYKSLSIWVPIKRNPGSTLVTVILPLIILGVISLAMLILRDRDFNSIGEASASLLVSAVLFAINLDDLTPGGGVLKRTDWIFFGTIIVVMINFIFSVLYSSTWFTKKRKPIITRISAWILPGLYLVLILYTLNFL